MILSLLAGALLTTAYAPFYFPIIAPIALCCLLLCWRNSSPWRAFSQGLIFGFGFFGVHTSWVYISIHTFGNTDIPLALLITSLFVFILSLGPAFLGYFLSKYFKKENAFQWLLVFPAGWIIVEWIFSWIFTGFPWAYLGYSQTTSWLKGYAPILGVYGMSFFVAFTASLLLLLIVQRWKIKLLAFLGIAIIWLGGLALSYIHWTKPTGKTLTVSLIQGNVPQSIKWDPNALQNTMSEYSSLTKSNLKSELIVWPEAAIPLPLQEATTYINKIDNMAKQHNTTVILGIPIQADEMHYYNAAIALGNSSGQYDKQHLVPFGEYVPFEKYLRGLIGFFNIPMSSFIANPKTNLWLTVNNIAIAPFICYEIAYPNLVRKSLPKAQLLLTISDDAWFGKSFASIQHLQLGQMRSLETGRYTVFVSNSGMTAIISPQGCLSQVVLPFRTAVLNSKVLAMTGETPWVFLGPWPILIFAFLCLLLGLITSLKGSSKKRLGIA